MEEGVDGPFPMAQAVDYVLYNNTITPTACAGTQGRRRVERYNGRWVPSQQASSAVQGIDNILRDPFFVLPVVEGDEDPLPSSTVLWAVPCAILDSSIVAGFSTPSVALLTAPASLDSLIVAAGFPYLSAASVTPLASPFFLVGLVAGEDGSLSSSAA